MHISSRKTYTVPPEVMNKRFITFLDTMDLSWTMVLWVITIYLVCLIFFLGCICSFHKHKEGYFVVESLPFPPQLSSFHNIFSWNMNPDSDLCSRKMHFNRTRCRKGLLDMIKSLEQAYYQKRPKQPASFSPEKK